MPRLACRTCGRQIYAVAPLAALFVEERRCPRCGAFLHDERREVARRLTHRRLNPVDDPGPPVSARASASSSAGERRSGDRRERQRRLTAGMRTTGAATGSAGWRG